MSQAILIGDVRAELAKLKKRSVHCVVTSPPYWGLRRYLFEGAVCIREDLTEEERSFLMRELEKHGIKPKS